MKRYEQRTADGRVIARFWRPERGYGNKPTGHDFLYGPADDDYGKLKVGGWIQFTGQTQLIRVK